MIAFQRADHRAGGPADLFLTPVQGYVASPCGNIAAFTVEKLRVTRGAAQGERPIARRPHQAPPTRDTGPRVNRMIRNPEIRLIDHEGKNHGVVDPRDAIRMAEEAGLDLVEISPNADPPVCKIMDFGKFKYESQKKANEAKKKQKVIEVKEVKFRPNIDTHDYDVKMRNVTKFLEGGDKVKVTLRFRGREMAHQEIGRELLQKIAGDIDGLGKIEAMPRMEGRQMVMVAAPLKH
jgi:translation initiation factor IF-3